MTDEKQAALRERYLALMETTLTGTLMEDPPLVTANHLEFVAGMGKSLFGQSAALSESAIGYQAGAREVGWDWPSRAWTMVGRARLRNFRLLVEDAIARGIPGDIVETGVWRGGASIFARGVLAAWDVTDRRIFVADSFAGLPPPNPALFPADSGSTFHLQSELAVTLEEVQENFRKFGLLDDQVVFVKGWFRDTMPTFPTAQIAVLRLDGDMYESTTDPLVHLYDRIPQGGWVIIDDYILVAACRQAVTDFLEARQISPEIIPIDGMGVYFQKP